MEGGEWMPLSGRGELWSYAVYHRALHPAFEGATPYAVGLIRLEEGPMLHGRLQDPPSVLACGMRVEAVFVELAPDVNVPQFRLIRDDND